MRGGVSVRVRNQGRLPIDAERRAIELFWRASEHERSDVSGTGLGLWEVDALVRAHGGAVELWAPSTDEVEAVIRLM
jgi:signal transduction histidine kinase